MTREPYKESRAPLVVLVSVFGAMFVGLVLIGLFVG